jgi:hypothetical protein
VDQRRLEHALERVQHRHLTFAGGRVAGQLDFVGGRCDGRGGLFSVRLRGGVSWLGGHRDEG